MLYPSLLVSGENVRCKLLRVFYDGGEGSGESSDYIQGYRFGAAFGRIVGERVITVGMNS